MYNRYLASVAGCCLLFSQPLSAIPFSWMDDQITGSFDSTITFGAGLRTEKRDPGNVGIPNGGLADTLNEDDGNLNYNQWDFYTVAMSSTHELDVSYYNWSLFFRFNAIHDWDLMRRTPRRTAHLDKAKARIGRDMNLLDLYLNWEHEFGDENDTVVSVRVGNQVLNWGESTFIPNGLNVINPFDLSKLRAAGAQLRDALLPVPLVRVDVQVSDNLTVGAFWQFHWEEVQIDPKGTFFSTNDFVSPGATFAVLPPSLGGLVDTASTTTIGPPPFGQSVRRGADREGSDLENYGVSAHYYSPELGDTEFGAFAAVYASRLPVISAFQGAAALAGPAAFIPNSFYFLEYPEDIVLLGASFNTNIGEIAVQGEYSIKFGQPIQIDDTQLLRAALGTSSQLGTFAAAGGAGEIRGWRRKTVSQVQATFTKNFGPMVGADVVILVGEGALNYVHGLEHKDVLNYEAPGTHYVKGFGTAFSGGYRLLVRGEYNNAIGPVNLIPSFAFAHDVFGRTPAPLLNFVKGRMSTTLSCDARYLHYSAGASYTAFFGAGVHNLLRDRNFLEFFASVAF